MPDQSNDELFAISGMDLMYLAQQQERLIKGNLLKLLVEGEGYKQISKDIFRNKKGEELKLFSHYEEQRYTNNNYPKDTGNVIQFVMNRMNPNGEVRINNELPYYCQAVSQCLDLENQLISRKPNKSMRHIKDDNPGKKSQKR